jgi:hypothetical protein
MDAHLARSMNLTGSEQAQPAAIPNWSNTREREHGQRWQVVGILPHDQSARHLSILQDVELELCKKFGGFTSNATQGGWLHEGKIIKDKSTTFNVSFSDPADVEEARQLFTLAGLLLGQDWIHIECHTFTAQHTRARSYS